MSRGTTLIILFILAAGSVALAKPKIVKVKVSSDSAAGGYEAWRAMDGNPQTMWHSIWGGGQTKLPHDLVVDLGAAYEISGFVCQAREGLSNGTIRDYDF